MISWLFVFHLIALLGAINKKKKKKVGAASVQEPNINGDNALFFFFFSEIFASEGGIPGMLVTLAWFNLVGKFRCI